YEVTDEHDDYIGLLYFDIFPRETKRPGAWMNTFQSQGLYKDGVKRPHVLIAASLTPSNDKTPSLLTMREAQTMFHEFGHAMHGISSQCKYKSLASPNVYWDFVELPSHIMENWIKEEEALKLFANHYKTGEAIPQDLLAKMKKAERFNKGFANIRQLSFGYMDMAWHNSEMSGNEDVSDFERKATAKCQLLPYVEGCNISCAMSHLFAGGYSAGYYSYKWAEALDADAFEKFKSDGIFNRETAMSFRDNILARGRTEHPAVLYKRFRGKDPDPNALLRRDGLI
ncbi:MAG: M3 family peptidase, partial [Candidatus Cloacimonetes bacterium]|nr:M3 family peptidase [Candidatus Cloacimonadota bacterium]